MTDTDGRIAQANRDLAASQERCRELEGELARCKAALGACDRAAELIERTACRGCTGGNYDRCRKCGIGKGMSLIRDAIEPEGEWRS